MYASIPNYRTKVIFFSVNFSPCNKNSDNCTLCPKALQGCQLLSTELLRTDILAL